MKVDNNKKETAMFFKRSNGEFRETDRVTRFKLIKSGKNWLRASTSNFGLLKVIRGQVEETIVAEVHEDAVSEKGLTSRVFLKGIVVAAAVLSATSLVHTGHADELGKDATTASALVSAPAVTTESESLSEQGSTDQSATLNESATETKEDTVVSSELVADAPVSEDKAILEQNASEAALLINIAEKYASNHQDADQKAAIHAAVANLQSELSASTSLANATAQAYADQRARLSKSVDELMAVLTVAGFEGNTTVNGSPVVSAQLDALSTSNTLTAPSVSPTMDQPNGASIEDPAWNNANYKLDPNADRYTYSIWDLQNWAGSANQGGVTYSNGGYYVTFSVDRATTGTTEAPKVHARLVEKATGKEVEALDMTANSTYQFKTLVQANPTYAPQFDYTLKEYAQILGTWTNNRDAGPKADDKYKHHILQVLDLAKPGNEGSTKPNVQTKIPREKITHTTYYKVEGTNEELASYSQTGIESQAYKASNPRSFEGYEFVRTDAEKDMSGFLGGVGAKYLELQGGRAHYYVKRIVEQIATDGTSVVKLYVLDPSKVSSYNPATDVNTPDLSNYTLVYTSDPVKPGEKPTPAGTKDATHSVGFVDSKDGQYHLKVETYTDGGNGNARLSGWFNKATGDAFTASPQFSVDVDPVRNNTSNIIGGNTPGDKASGYPSFFNNYSLPTVKEISTNVTHYYRKSDVKGNVYVHYQDTEGKTIKPDVTDEKDQPVNKVYDTVVDNRPNEITFEGKTYELVPAGNYTVGEVDDQGHLTSSDPTTGAVAKEDKNVTYIYKLKEGEVVITYVDENGKEIQKPRQDTPNSPYDTPYDTTEEGEKPNFIKAEDGKTYKIVPKGDYPVGKVDENGHLEKSDPVTGKVTKPKSTITYVYKEVNGNVYVHYVDTEGKTIKDDVTDEKAQPVDKDYDTVVDNRPQEIEFEGKTYELVPAGTYTAGEVDDQGHLKTTDPTTGKVIEGNKNVTYVYKLKEKPKGEVVITYVDEKGKEIQKPRQDTPNSPYDTPYDTTEEGEKPNFIKAEDGKAYKIVPKGDYPVGKVDENGHLEKSDPVTGKVTKPKSTITYVYKEVNGNVYVHYVDTEGKTIKSDVTDEDAQPVDKDYDTVVDNRPQEIEFEGKTYELVPAGNYTVGEVDDEGHLTSSDTTTGKVAEQDKNVTYIYKLKEEPVQPKGSVFVHYKDTEGNELKTSVTDMDKEPVDSDYDTVVDNRPQEIEKDGKTYVLVPAGTYPVGEVDDEGHLTSSDTTTGKVAEQDKNVTYIYKLKEEPVQPKGSVYVHYKDTEGNELKASVTDMDKEPVDSAYDTVVDNRPKEIEKDGKTYVLVPAGNYPVGEVDDQGHLTSSDDTTGKVAEQDKNVTYVYKLKETPDKPVEPTPDKPVEPTPDKPVNPTPGKPVNPTPGKPVDPTPGKPVNPTPGKPVNPTPGKPVDPTPGKPVDPTPGKPVSPTPDKPVSEKPANPTSAKEQLPNTGETTSAGSTVLGVVAGLVGLAALGRRKKEDEK